MMNSEPNQKPLDPRDVEGGSFESAAERAESSAIATDERPLDPAGSLAQIAVTDLEELKKKAAKADEHWDRLLRTTADLENYKKRAARERQEAIRYANEALLEKLAPVLDTFDMALAAAGTGQAGTTDSFRAGVAMIHSQLKNVLRDAGLEEIDATNQPFDPNWHEAVSQMETAEAPEGQVVQQLRKGYKLRERLLRPATVIVAKKPAS